MNTETNAQTLTEKLKAQINALKTKEGRTALAARARNLTMAQKLLIPDAVRHLFKTLHSVCGDRQRKLMVHHHKQ